VTLAFMSLFSWALPVAAAGALAACVGRRWKLAAAMSRAVLLTALVFVSLLAARIVASMLTPVDPALKATIYSAGISELIICSTLPFAAVLVSAATWIVARRRLRSG
jgi:hypothetical protein